MLTMRFQVINLNDNDNETIKILFDDLLPGYRYGGECTGDHECERNHFPTPSGLLWERLLSRSMLPTVTYLPL